MKTKKIIIGSGLLLALGGAAYYFIKKSIDSAASTVRTPSTSSGGGIIPGGVPATVPTALFPPGTLIQSGEGKVWLINDSGERQWITSRKKYEAMGYKKSDIVPVDSSVPGMIPRGSDISGLI